MAPPPPKSFTDEELKQQFGIHLATRLQSDETGKESKWADIDDDEVEWVPETVAWMDGTKSTLIPSEAAPAQKPADQQPQPPLIAKPAEGPKPSLAAMKKPGDMGPPKTILKPGIAALQAKQQNGAAAGSPGHDKLSLTAKSTLAAPAKSPWAAVPPIDAVSPINPPVQQQQQPQLQTQLPTQDARAYESAAPAPPAREIAADTFDRSWREGEGGARELFNAASGRYEQAPEGRRRSVKPDESYRKPAVLQRQSQSGSGHAEPSAAFQTRTNSQTDGAPFGRRRGSSVSQGSSLPPGRRMSTASRAPDLSPAPERQHSIVAGHDMRGSPVSARNEPQRPTFAQQSAWEQQMPARPAPSEEVEDAVKIQERVMREKRELAVKRRKEEEAHAEAESQERLKAKLAALEGAGKSRKEREAEAAAASVALRTPATEKSNDLAQKVAEVASQTPSEPPPSQTVDVEPEANQPIPFPAEAQQTSNEEMLPLPAPLPPKPQQANVPEQPTSSTEQAQRQAPKSHLSPRANARAPFGQQPAPYRAPNSAYSSPGDRKPQPSFGRSPLMNDPLAGLSEWSNQTTSGNVWGTSGIGNGTFESSNSFAPVPRMQQGSALPPPPGMGRPSTSTRISPQGYSQEARSPNLQQQHLAEQQRTFPPPGIDSRPELWGQSRQAGASPAPGLGRQTHLPGPIAPPSRAQQQQQQQPAQRPDAIGAWTSAAQRLPYQYVSEAHAAEQKKPVESAPSQPLGDTMKETFKQTSTEQGRLGGPRRYEKTEYTVHDVQGSRPVSTLSPAPPSAQTQPMAPMPSASPLDDPWKAAGEKTVRIPDGSLNPAHGGFPQEQSSFGPPSAQQPPTTAYQGNMQYPAATSAPPLSSKDESPPPPETSTHPVNDGGLHRPNVKLPPPPPVVKLPPAPAHSPAQQHAAMAPQRYQQTWGPPGAARPIVANADWQARFNGLFGRTHIHTEVPPSPPKTPPKAQGPALAVASSSRPPMDEMSTATWATVSLPQKMALTSAEGFSMDDSDDVVSKPTIEQMFNEELSFGSLPRIQVPRNPIYDTEVYGHDSQANMLRMGTNMKFHRNVDAQSARDLNMGFFYKHPDGIFVKIPGTKLNNKLVTHLNASRKSSGMQERKPSAKFNKPARGKHSGPASPVTNGTPNAGSRTASYQKATDSPATGSPAPHSSPATNAENTRRQSKWARPAKSRTPSVKAS